MDVKKAKKILSTTFLEDNETVTLEAAKNSIIDAEKQINELKEQMDTDANLNEFKEKVKDLSSGYKDAINYEKAKIQFLLWKLGMLNTKPVV